MKENPYGKILHKAAVSLAARSFPPKEGAVGWSCPSNIAIIKYWGKRSEQLPMNPSLSLTLDEARTRTTVTYQFDPVIPAPKIRFLFEGNENPAFLAKVEGYITRLIRYLPLLAHTDLLIRSENSFPHSSGIASSASAMGALALCLGEIEAQIAGGDMETDPARKASFLARLGSGSASRSLFPHMALWGRSQEWDGSSDEYAIPVTGFHESFSRMRDAILIVESAPKKVSSTAGHALMDSNPFSRARYRQAQDNLTMLKTVLQEGDWDGFLQVLENEALTLHALMMAGQPGFLLMQPATIAILQRVRSYREETGSRLGFSLDAGANVHLVYSASEAQGVERFIRAELLPLCENGRILFDRMGKGPLKI